MNIWECRVNACRSEPSNEVFSSKSPQQEKTQLALNRDIVHQAVCSRLKAGSSKLPGSRAPQAGFNFVMPSLDCSAALRA